VAIAFGTPSTGGGVFAPGSTTVQTTLTVSAGSTILAAVTTAGSSGTITCSDNVNGAYTVIDTLTDATFTSTTTFFRFTNSASGSLTITGSFPSNNFPIISAVEITGAVTTGIDGHNAAQQTAGSGSTLSPGSFSNGTQPALVVGYNINDTGNCATTGAAGYTVVTTGAATGSWQWQRVTSTGAQAPTWTSADFGGHMTFGVAIDEAASGVSVAMTGLSATASRGTASPAVAPALTGQAASSARGTLGPAVSVALTGLAATVQQGTVTPPAGGNALTGQQATTSQGTPVPSVSVALSGLAASVAGGSLAGSTSPPLGGLSASVAAGTMAAAVSVPVAGSVATVGLGTLTPPVPPVSLAITMPIPYTARMT